MTSLEFLYQFNILYDKVSSLANPGYKKREVEVFLNKAVEEILLRYYDSKEKAIVGNFESNELTRVYLDTLLKEYSVTNVFLPHSGDTSSSVPTVTGVAIKSDRKNGYYVKLPYDHLVTVLEEFNIQYKGLPRVVRVKPMQYDEYGIDIMNPFKAPNYRNFYWRMNYNSKVYELITDGNTVNYYSNSYIKQPLDIILEVRTVTTIEPFKTYNVTAKTVDTGVSYNGVDYDIDMTFIGVPGITTFTGGTVTTVITGCELPEILHKRVVETAVRIATGTTNPEVYQIKYNEENTSK